MSTVSRTSDSILSRPLDPQIVQALKRFLKRRNFIKAVRGCCMLLLTFLAAFGLVAAIDYFWMVDDGLRLIGSLCAYGVTIAVAFFAVLRQLVQSQSLESIAGSFERAEPKLRNHLLSAVELGDGEWDQESASAGSPQLRQLLQRRVGKFIAGVNIGQLIPLSVVQPWMNIAGGLAALVVAGIFVPGSPLGLLYARALAPTANLARASTTKVTILKPDLSLGFVAANEVLLVEAAIEGLRDDSVVLEVRDQQRQKHAIRMRSAEATDTSLRETLLQAARLFHCNLEVLDQPFEFRVLAGDAITAWHFVQPRLRPEVLHLETTIQFPAYAKLEPLTVDCESPTQGQAIMVLQGSQIALEASLNQSISAAKVEFLVDSEANSGEAESDGQSSQPLERSGLDKVKHDFGTVDRSQRYRLWFASAETGFENVFPPTHSIDVIEDSPPIPRLSIGGAVTMTAVARDLVPVQAEVRDELPMDQMVLEYAVNERDWKEFPVNLQLAINEASSAPERLRVIYATATEVDLSKVVLREGDLLRLRLSATDRKGQNSPSNEVELMVTADYFTPDRYQFLNRRLAWLQMILDWSDSEDPKDNVAQIIETAKQLLGDSPAGVDALEVELLARAIVSVEQNVEARPGRSENERKRLRSAAMWFTAFTANDWIARDLHALYASAERMRAFSERNSDAWNLRQLEMLSWNYKSCLDQYQRLQEPMPDSVRRALRGIMDQLQQQRDRIDSLAQEDVQRRRIQDEQAFQFQQLGYRRDNPVLDGSIYGNAIDGLRSAYQLRTLHGKLLDRLAKLLKEQSELTAKQAKLDDAEQTIELRQKLQEKNETFKRTVLQLDGQLTTLHAVHQARKDVNPVRLEDLDLVQRVVSALLSQKVPGIDLVKAFEEVAQATSILDVGQDVFEYERLLRLLALEERWNGDTLTLRLENPRRWDYWGRGVELTVADLRGTTISHEPIHLLDQLRYSDPAGNIGRNIGNRRWDKNWKTTVGDDLDVVLARYTERKIPIDQQMEQARQTLRKYLPETDSAESSKNAAEQQTESLERQTQQAEASGEQQQTGEPSELAALPQVELSDLLEAAKQSSAEELLKALEEELKSNRPMQEELSQISSQILQQAQEQLERAAQDEYESERSLEQSDISVREEKELAVRQLQDLAQQVDQVRSQVAQQARSAAARGAAKDAIDRLSEADETLQDAANEARRASTSMLANEIAQQAEKTNVLLEAAEEKLKAGEAAAAKATGQELENEPNRSRTRDQMKALQNTTKDNLARNAEQRERQWRQQQRNYENQANNATRQQENANNRLEKAQQAATAKPEDKGLQQAAAEARKAAERTAAEVATFSAMKERAENLANKAQQEAVATRQAESKPLQSNNPAAEVAEQLAERGAELAAQLSETSEQIKQSLESEPGIQAEQNQLAATANQQAQIQSQVKQVAESLERAARHEQRLGSEPAGERLQQLASAIRDLAEGSIESAKQTSENLRNQLTESNDRASTGDQGREAANALAEAREAIRGGLDALSDVAAKNAADTQPATGESASGEPATGEPATGEPATGEPASGADSQSVAATKARTLDDLDRALHGQSASDSEQANGPANALGQSSTLTQAQADQASAEAQQAGQAEGNPEDDADRSQQLANGMSPGGTLDGQASAQPFSGLASDSPILKSMEDWGDLRQRKADEGTEGKRTLLPRKYQRQIEAYFRSISEKGNQ